MAKPYPTKPAPVPHLCGAIAKVAKLMRRHTKPRDPDRLEVLRLLREVQDGIHQLRVNAQHCG